MGKPLGDQADGDRLHRERVRDLFLPGRRARQGRRVFCGFRRDRVPHLRQPPRREARDRHPDRAHDAQGSGDPGPLPRRVLPSPRAGAPWTGRDRAAPQTPVSPRLRVRHDPDLFRLRRVDRLHLRRRGDREPGAELPDRDPGGDAARRRRLRGHEPGLLLGAEPRRGGHLRSGRSGGHAAHPRRLGRPRARGTRGGLHVRHGERLDPDRPPCDARDGRRRALLEARGARERGTRHPRRRPLDPGGTLDDLALVRGRVRGRVGLVRHNLMALLWPHGRGALRVQAQGAPGPCSGAELSHAPLPDHPGRVHPGHGRDRCERLELERMAGRSHADLIYWQPPGYSYVLAWIYSTPGLGYVAPRIVHAFLGAASAVMTAWIGARHFGRGVGLAAGYGAALYGMLIYFDGELLTPTLTIALQLAAVPAALLASDNPRRSTWLWGGSGALAGLASIVTATSVVIVAVLAAFARRRAWLVLLGAALAIAPVTWRNWKRGGEFIPISWNGGINLYIGNNPRYDETVAIRPDLHWKRFVLEPRREGVRGVGAASNYFVGKVLIYAGSDPLGFARLQLKKVYLFLAGNEIPRNEEIYPAREYSPVLRLLLWKVPGLAFPFGLLMPLGLVGMAVRWRRAPMLAAIVVAYGAAVLAFFITARYRMPLVPYLLIFAAAGVRWLFKEARAPARAAAIASVVVLFLLGNLAQGPMPNTMNADAEYSLGVKLAVKGLSEEATRLFESAIRKHPDYSEAWVNLGVLQATHGRAADGERSLSRAIEVDAENAPALTNLAVLREMSGRPDEARALYQRAYKIDPSDEFTRRKLAALASPNPTPLETAQPLGGKPK